jgi:hypothetical protein
MTRTSTGPANVMQWLCKLEGRQAMYPEPELHANWVCKDLRELQGC